MRISTCLVISAFMVLFATSAKAQGELVQQNLNEVADEGAEGLAEGTEAAKGNNSPFLEDFKKLSIGYIGRTKACGRYNVYAFKYYTSWFLAINVENTNNLTVFLARPPRSTEVLPIVSSFVVEGLHGAMTNNYTKFKPRRRKVNDLEIYGFYKMRKQGKRVARGILLVEFPEDVNKEPKFFLFKWIKDLFSDKLEEVTPEVPDVEVPDMQEKLNEQLDKAREQIDAIK